MRIALITVLAVFSVSCTATTQLTSGADYLDRSATSPNTLNTNELEAYAQGASIQISVDEQVRAIAAVEPDLRFPARIGLARIEYGKLTTVPPAELAVWGELVEELGPDIGEFVPVNPLIAAMVRPAQLRGRTGEPDAAAIIADVRRGSARQHLDYVFLYELSEGWEDTANHLSVADLSILGLFILPSRDVKAYGSASGLLLDVRSGYPYGTASSLVEEQDVSPGIGAWGRGRELAEAARLTAVEQLTDEVSVLFNQLREQLASQAIQVSEG